jgi:hypothetical protein
MYGDTDYLTSLIDKTIQGIDVGPEEAALRFRIMGGDPVVWETEGDCCSESWWADGFSLNQLRGARVKEVNTIEMPKLPDDDQRTRQEYDEVYGIELVTTKGVAKLVFRNSSNGYYGGWCGLGAADSAGPWKEIEGNDWSA